MVVASKEEAAVCLIRELLKQHIGERARKLKILRAKLGLQQFQQRVDLDGVAVQVRVQVRVRRLAMAVAQVVSTQIRVGSGGRSGNVANHLQLA